MEISCVLNYNTYMNFLKFSQKKALKIFRLLGYIMIVCSIIYGVATFTNEIIYDELIGDIVFMCITALAGLYLVFRIKPLTLKIYEKTINSNKIMSSNPTIAYSFNENNFRVLLTCNYCLEDCTYSYDIINHIVEVDNAIYVYIANNTAHIIEKTIDNNEAYNDVSNFLKDKFGSKYMFALSKKWKLQIRYFKLNLYKLKKMNPNIF